MPTKYQLIFWAFAVIAANAAFIFVVSTLGTNENLKTLALPSGIGILVGFFGMVLVLVMDLRYPRRD